jgi:Glycosyl Hydrolase Family 88
VQYKAPNMERWVSLILITLATNTVGAHAIDTTKLNYPTISNSIAISKDCLKRFSNIEGFPSEYKDGWKIEKKEAWESGYIAGIWWDIYRLLKTGGCTNEAMVAYDTAIKKTEDLNGIEWHAKKCEVGIITYSSYKRAYEETKEERYKQKIIDAAHSLSTRWIDRDQAFKAWGKLEDTNKNIYIIDTLISLPVLLEAQTLGSKNWVSDTSYETMIKHHVNTISHLLIREDGGVHHLATIDQNGIVKKEVGQGKSTTSIWSRGQAWAIYGLATLYRKTKDPYYKDLAKKVADFYVKKCPNGEVPPSDFDDDEPRKIENQDSSAAAIATLGLLILSKEVPQEEGVPYYECGIKTLSNITNPPYLNTSSSGGLLPHSKRNDSDTEQKDYIWGDYYLLEAIIEADKNNKL